MYKSTESQAFFSVSLEALQQMINQAVKSAIHEAQNMSAPAPEEDPLLNVSQVADLLKVSPISVYRYAKFHNLPHIKGRKHLLFKKSDVLLWINRDMVYSSPEAARLIVQELKKKGGK